MSGRSTGLSLNTFNEERNTHANIELPSILLHPGNIRAGGMTRSKGLFGTVDTKPQILGSYPL